MNRACLTFLFALGLATPALAQTLPEGAIWDHRGVNLAGARFQISLTIRHGHLLMILPRGEVLDCGAVELNGYNEFEAPNANFRSAFPAVSTMTFKFSQDFSSVIETDIMNYQGRCVGGNCENNISTVDYNIRR